MAAVEVAFTAEAVAASAEADSVDSAVGSEGFAAGTEVSGTGSMVVTAISLASDSDTILIGAIGAGPIITMTATRIMDTHTTGTVMATAILTLPTITVIRARRS